MSDDRTTTPSTPLPALAIADADGVRRTVTGIDTTTTVGALADLLGIAGHRSVTIDGRPEARTVGLARTGIAQGSTVRPGVADDGDLMARRNACPARAERRGHPVDPPARHGAMPRTGTVAVVEFESGPAVGAPVALAAGRHVVGRATGAAVRLLDDRAELHHGVLDIDGTGVRFTQLTGRTPCDLGGPADTAHAERRTFALGASRISVRPVAGAATAPATLRDHPADPWRRTLHRAPRHHPRWVPPPVEVPGGDARSTSPRPAGLLAMVAPMLAGVVVAVVLRNPMYLVLSGVGGLVALATGLVRQASDRRRHRRSSVERRQEVERFIGGLGDRRRARAAFERETTPTIGDALEALALGAPGHGVGGRVLESAIGAPRRVRRDDRMGRARSRPRCVGGVAAPRMRAGADESQPPRPRAGGSRPRSRRGDRRRRRARRRGRSVAGGAVGDVVRAGRLAPRRRRRRPGGVGLGRVAAPCVRRRSAVGARCRRRRRARRRLHRASPIHGPATSWW